jgi:hypothetical protein
MSDRSWARAAFAATAWAGLIAGSAQAAVIDTYTRADGSPVTDSVGGTEAGGFDYVERGNTPSQAIASGTAQIVNNELALYGASGPANSNFGGVYLAGYESPDLTISATVRFVHTIAAPTAAEELANTFIFTLRSQAAMNLAATSAGDDGLLDVQIGPNGDVLVRENRNGTLTQVISQNLITGGATTRRRLAPGALPATFNGLPFDADQDGFIDDGETFSFGANVSGTTLQLFVNGLQVGSNLTLTETAGLNGSGVGLHKNRISAAFETASDVFADNLDISPVPEPASFAALALAAGSVLARGRRRR